MSRTNETRHIKWHDRCKYICRLDATVCSNKQRWNNDKCQCEFKELIDKGVCDKWYAWNPGNCESECDKTCKKTIIGVSGAVCLLELFNW